MLEAGAVITLELGHYRLRERIGGSAYGVVWRASGPRATPDVALKLINEQQMALALPQQRQRWSASACNEIAFLQSLEPWDERHIVRLLDSGSHDGLPVLALELMDGDLGQHVAAVRQAGRRIPFTRILDWIGQVNQALAKVHQYGWRYLDLKPSNILLERGRDRVKLADFGTNRAAADPHPHSYAGTANWQAPEQFFPTPAGGYASEARSDYFALGALFYFLVTGGMALRFCSDCGQAFREHHVAGAGVLLRRGGGAPPATLRHGEEALFLRRLALAGCDNGAAALRLLRALLGATPAERPANAIQISRMLAAAGGLPAPAPAELLRAAARPAAHNGWPLRHGA